MPDVTWTHPFLHRVLAEVPNEARRFLDVGCGRGLIGAITRIYREPDMVVGIEGFRPYVDFVKRLGLYDSVIVADLREITITDNYDIGYCIEVIEHLPKQAGYRLLTEMERTCQKVLVTTPKRAFRQAAYDVNEFQQHLSHWSESDFQSRGYQVKRPPLYIGGKTRRILSGGLSRLVSNYPDETILAVRQS